VTLQKYFSHPRLVIYFFFQPSQQQVLRCAVLYTNLSILWENAGPKSFWEGKPNHHVLIFLHPIFPCRAGGAALTLFPSWKRMTPYGCSYLISIPEKD